MSTQRVHAGQVESHGAPGGFSLSATSDSTLVDTRRRRLLRPVSGTPSHRVTIRVDASPTDIMVVLTDRTLSLFAAARNGAGRLYPACHGVRGLISLRASRREHPFTAAVPGQPADRCRGSCGGHRPRARGGQWPPRAPSTPGGVDSRDHRSWDVSTRVGVKPSRTGYHRGTRAAWPVAVIRWGGPRGRRGGDRCHRRGRPRSG